MRVVIVTLDNHLAGAVSRAARLLRKDLPALELELHACSDFEAQPDALERCRAAIGQADIVIATMLFMEAHFEPLREALETRAPQCDAMVCCMSAGEIMRLTRMGGFRMDGSAKGPMSLLKRLRGKPKSADGKGQGRNATDGEKQMRMLRRLPKLLRFVPGTAQDVRAYFLTLQYWLAGSDHNVANMVRCLVQRYASGEREALRAIVKAQPPREYPDVGVYHPRLRGRMAESAAKLPQAGPDGRVGLLIMRSYVLAGDTGHFDGVIDALEARGLSVVPAFASGLDARPAVERFFVEDGRATVDAVVSLTGFSLVGGPAYNDVGAAEKMLAELDVPCIAAHPLEFQTLDAWRASEQGLHPVESTMMVAIPELDGSIAPMVFGGRGGEDGLQMQAEPERVEMLAGRVGQIVRLRRTAKDQRRLAIVLFSFPPNAGNIGSAAHLSVYASLYNTLRGLDAAGYRVDVPESVDALRDSLLEGNARQLGTPANVMARVPADEHVRREPYLAEIESQWGPAPGRHQTDGRDIYVLGAEFGNVVVCVQPAFGYEGDPMRLLFEHGFAPTHAFAAFYRYLREDFGASALLHFGTHGALEFMPGKQNGLGASCWPERLLRDVPNFYLYAANNPSEGTIAKRRSAATLVSYLTPPVAHAGLYSGLDDLKASLERWRGLGPDASESERTHLEALLQAQAAELDLCAPEPAWAEPAARIAILRDELVELEDALIPYGLHVVGDPAPREERVEQVAAMAEVMFTGDAASGQPAYTLPRAAVEALVDGAEPDTVTALCSADAAADLAARIESLARTSKLLAEDHEVEGIVRALDGRYVPPAPGGDLLRNPDVLPSGRNLHGFDPFRIPSAYAVADGARQALRLLARHHEQSRAFPESVALVLWGTDNLKSEGGPIAQALALLGARPRYDSYGRLAGAELVPLDELGRPRIDVLMTLSGIFRDLLPLQTRMLAEAAYLAATADEAPERNFVRMHALEYAQANGCDMETAALRVFSNADGAYGSNVNHLIDSGAWSDEDELGDTYTRRKCFAYGRSGGPVQHGVLLESVLSKVELAYQNLESVELGVTTVDHYFDTLGGIGRAVAKAKGAEVPVYIGDQTRGEGKVRTLNEQVALEARTRLLNPKWYESMLEHGYEGVRHVEAHVTNTMGWSATTGQVAPWVYQQISQTYVLDREMRERLAALNPVASANVANRLIEAHERNYWSPDADVLAALREAGDELEDRVEGVQAGAPA